MSNGFMRYYKRERVTAECEILTPMFLGGADQSAQWRVAPFKALLRKWWRVAHGQGLKQDELYQKESELFGAAGEKGSDLGKSSVIVSLWADAKSSEERMPNVPKVNQPECQRNNGDVSPLLYLAGMGLMAPNGNVKHSYFKPGEKFRLTIEAGKGDIENLKPALRLIQTFGTIGGRSRNAWGSFSFKPGDEFLAEPKFESWEKGFERDYPALLGRDITGELIWKTVAPQKDDKNNWESIMSVLADAYINVRARSLTAKGKTLGKLNPGAGSADERHLLGIPLTNHAAFGNTARHASPLHFKVLKLGSFYHGVILHLPHKHSDRQPILGGDKTQQIEVWKKVHQKLDAISSIQRATMAELR